MSSPSATIEPRGAPATVEPRHPPGPVEPHNSPAAGELRGALAPGTVAPVAAVVSEGRPVSQGAGSSPPPPLSAGSGSSSGGALAAAPRAEAPAARQRFVVAAMGDSLTDAAASGGGYLAYLQKHCPESRFDNFGVGGEMVNQMRRRLERDVFTAGQPAYSHLIVFGGVNDLYSDLTAGRVPAKIEQDLSWMFARARASGVRLVALTVAPWGGFKRYFNPRRHAATLELNAWIRQEGTAGRVEHVVDAYALLSCGEGHLLCPSLAPPFKDGLHFGPLGHQRLGQALLEQVFVGCL